VKYGKKCDDQMKLDTRGSEEVIAGAGAEATTRAGVKAMGVSAKRMFNRTCSPL